MDCGHSNETEWPHNNGLLSYCSPARDYGLRTVTSLPHLVRLDQEAGQQIGALKMGHECGEGGKQAGHAEPDDHSLALGQGQPDKQGLNQHSRSAEGERVGVRVISP